jgi:hypothetical protein
MEKNMTKREKFNLILLNIFCALALILIVFPLLMIAKYDRASADDWSYGVYGYNVIKDGGNILGVVKAALKTAAENYTVWEGRFANSFLAALQPGIFGESRYGVVPWIMIGMLIISETFLCSTIIGLNGRKNLWNCIPVIFPALVIQILYTPSIVESFYWYTGAVNYTFIYGLSLVLLGIYIKLSVNEYDFIKKFLLIIASSIMSILAGGDNFATSLSITLTFVLLSATQLFINKNRKAFFRTLHIPVITGISMAACVFAPGNTNRLNGNFGGTTGNALEAVFSSFTRTWLNVRIWSNLKILLLIMLILPFIWRIVKDMKFSFRLPLLFTLVSYGVYSSEITATMYVDGTTGGGRMNAVLYYSYILWLLLNTAYWLGWLTHRESIKSLFVLFEKYYGKYILIYFIVIGAVCAAAIYKTDLKTISSYKAYRDYRQGWAKQYAVEWDERYELLHDDNVKEIVFDPISVLPETLMYTDLQDEYGYTWVNSACATYYGKTSIEITSE